MKMKMRAFLSRTDQTPVVAGTTVTRPAPVRRRRPQPGTVLIHVLLILFVVMAIGPVLIALMNSFKTQLGIFASPFELPTAETFSIEGYVRAISQGEFTVYYRNSLVVTGVSVLLTVGLASLAAYALTEYKVRLAPVLSGLFIIGIMLPIRLGTVSLLELMRSLHLIDTVTALILVYTAMSLPLGVALMSSYFRSVPGELKDAARVDGAGELRTLALVLPLVRPGLAATASITMLPVWNDLWFPLILAPSPENQTVVLGVQQFMGQYDNDWPALLAALMLGALPLVVLFVIFSKQFIKGLSEGYGK